jgi:hypothetical protein
MVVQSTVHCLDVKSTVCVEAAAQPPVDRVVHMLVELSASAQLLPHTLPTTSVQIQIHCKHFGRQDGIVLHSLEEHISYSTACVEAAAERPAQRRLCGEFERLHQHTLHYITIHYITLHYITCSTQKKIGKPIQHILMM